MNPSRTGRCPDLRCPHCAPGATPTPDAPIIRQLQVALWSCPCRSCGASALVLSSGANRPYCYCANCRSCTAAPGARWARSRWRAGKPIATPAETQLTLF